MKIKPCPFCARADCYIVKFQERVFCVACKCGAEAPGNSVSENGAIRIWNRRRLHQRLLDDVKKFALKGWNLKNEGQLNNNKPVLVMQVYDIIKDGN